MDDGGLLLSMAGFWREAARGVQGRPTLYACYVRRAGTLSANCHGDRAQQPTAGPAWLRAVAQAMK